LPFHTPQASEWKALELELKLRAPEALLGSRALAMEVSGKPLNPNRNSKLMKLSLVLEF